MAVLKRIVKKQNNSKDCLVCGLANRYGLCARFFETEEREVVAKLITRDEHQSYPGRLHGGIASAILDETMGRAIMAYEPEAWGVTAELTIKIRKPIPTEEELTVLGRVTKMGGRIFEGSGEIILKDGSVAATATGRFIKMPIHRIVDNGEAFVGESWFLEEEESPETIEIPESAS